MIAELSAAEMSYLFSLQSLPDGGLAVACYQVSAGSSHAPWLGFHADALPPCRS